MLDEKHLISETAVMSSESSNIQHKCVCRHIFTSLITDSTGVFTSRAHARNFTFGKGKITGLAKVRLFMRGKVVGHLLAPEGFNLHFNLRVFLHVSQRAQFTAPVWMLALWGCIKED